VRLSLWHLSAILFAISGASAGAPSTPLREAIEAQAADPRIHGALQRLYAGGRPVWMRGLQPGPQAYALERVLQGAADKGLRAGDYWGPPWSERLERPTRTEEEANALDAALSAAAMRYVSDLADGRIDPQRVGADLDFLRGGIRLADVVRSLIDASDVAAALDAVEPQIPMYRRALLALQSYRELEKRDSGNQRIARAAKAASCVPGTTHASSVMEVLACRTRWRSWAAPRGSRMKPLHSPSCGTQSLH
jgi:murein L,D-transpeptidase YcbB/YkuD